MKTSILLTILVLTFTVAAQAQTSFLLGNSPHKHHTIQDIQKAAANNEAFGVFFTEAYSQNFRPLTSNWGAEKYRALKILPLSQGLTTKQVLEFKTALETQKPKLMQAYKLRNSTYNRLAAMALGIFGNESEFGTSFRLKLKENFQNLVVIGKVLQGQDDLTTSRGVTQIKNLPPRIQQIYPQVQLDSLMVPFNAAVATIGYLVQTFTMLLDREDLAYINASNVFDYMPYVYSGQMGKLLNHTATVVDNSYIVHMKQNIRKFYFMEQQ